MKQQPLKKLNSIRRQLFCGLVGQSSANLKEPEANCDAPRRQSSTSPSKEPARGEDRTDQGVADRLAASEKEQSNSTSDNLLRIGPDRKQPDQTQQQEILLSNNDHVKPKPFQSNILIEPLREYFHQLDLNQASEFTIEDSWLQIVDLRGYFENLCEPLDEQAELTLKIQQGAIWELCTTEVFYLKRLNSLIKLFLNSLLYLQEKCSLLLEIDARKMFSNIAEIYKANCLLWQQHLEPILMKSRSSKCPLDPTLMKNAFLQVSCPITTALTQHLLPQTTQFHFYRAPSNFQTPLTIKLRSDTHSIHITSTA